MVTLEPGEQHLYSFTVWHFERRRAGGLLLKITAWFSTDVSFTLHLTDRRVILEPVQHSLAHRLAQSFAIQGFKMLVGAVSGVHVIGGTTPRPATIDASGYYAISYSDVHEFDSVKQSWRRLARIVPKGGIDRHSLPAWGIGVAGQADEFLRIANGLLQHSRA